MIQFVVPELKLMYINFLCNLKLMCINLNLKLSVCVCVCVCVCVYIYIKEDEYLISNMLILNKTEFKSL
jgi:type IV secretory pathway VirB3-like protein